MIKNIKHCQNCGNTLTVCLEYDEKGDVYKVSLLCKECKLETHPHFIGPRDLELKYQGHSTAGSINTFGYTGGKISSTQGEGEDGNVTLGNNGDGRPEP